MHHLLLIIHLLSAAVWVGGHIFLCTGILPEALRHKDVERILQFEKVYEPIGLPALVLLVITGVIMVLQLGILPRFWFQFSNRTERIISFKIILLLCTVALALSAQLRVIPVIKKPGKLFEMALHIVAVTLIGITLLVLGSFIRH